MVIRDGQGVFTADPQCVVEHYALEWKRRWGCKDTFAYHQELQSIRAPRETHFEDAGEWAKRTRRECCKCSHGVSLFSFQNGGPPRPTLFPGHCPTSGHRLCLARRNCQAELCQISHTNSVAFAVAGFVRQEKTEVAELSPSCTPLIVPPCV